MPCCLCLPALSNSSNVKSLALKQDCNLWPVSLSRRLVNSFLSVVQRLLCTTYVRPLRVGSRSSDAEVDVLFSHQTVLSTDCVLLRSDGLCLSSVFTCVSIQRWIMHALGSCFIHTTVGPAVMTTCSFEYFGCSFHLSFFLQTCFVLHLGSVCKHACF